MAYVLENTAASTVVYNTRAIDNSNGEDEGIIYTFGGVDAGLFNFNTSNGEVTFKVSPDFEAPTDTGNDNIYNFTVTATDPAGNTDNRDIALEVTNVGGSAGDTVISLGVGLGQLINGIQVEGKWYYQWDVNGDNTIQLGTTTGGPDDDRVSMDFIATSFFNDPSGSVINEVNRTFSVEGMQLALPTSGVTPYPATVVGNEESLNNTTWSNATPGWDTTLNSNLQLTIWQPYGTLLSMLATLLVVHPLVGVLLITAITGPLNPRSRATTAISL